MKTIIAGSRTITGAEGRKAVVAAIKAAKIPITEVVCGEARGPDSLGKAWAHNKGIPVKSFPADWEQYGKTAGFRRNAEMAEYADALVAVWDGRSRGTYDMIRKAEAHDLDTTIVYVRNHIGTLNSFGREPDADRYMVVPLA